MIETLRIYKRYEKKLGNDNEINKLLKEIEGIKQPGLNDILSKYNAKNGINPYKEKFHQMFENRDENVERSMNKRPIDEVIISLK